MFLLIIPRTTERKIEKTQINRKTDEWIYGEIFKMLSFTHAM